MRKIVDTSISPEVFAEIMEVLNNIDSLKTEARVENLSRIERLGGLTNRNFRITIQNRRYALRLAGIGTSSYIDRNVEKHNALLAAEIGLNTQVLYYDETKGHMLCHFIENAITLTSESFRDPRFLEEVAKVMRKLHTCNKTFLFHFDVFDMIDSYIGVLIQKNTDLPSSYGPVQKDLLTIREILQNYPVPLAPCHNDPVPENFIYNGKRLFYIDWEYSGMNDPMWDLGDFSVEVGLNENQERHLMDVYFNSEPPRHQHGRMVMYKALCDYLWSLWAIIQVVNNRPEFREYGETRFRRFCELVSRKDFSWHLSAIEKQRN